MLAKVELRNFKLHAHTSIEATPITIFIGPNNSGKSSIFQALLSLRQAAAKSSPELLHPIVRQQSSEGQPFLFSEQEIINVGEFGDIVRRGENEIRIGVEGALPEKTISDRSISIKVKFDLEIRKNRLAQHGGRVSCQSGKIEWYWTELAGQTPPNIRFPMEGPVLDFLAEPHFALIRNIAITGKPVVAEKQRDTKTLADMLGNSVVHFLNTLHPISPLRGFEEWSYPLPEAPAGNLDRLALADRAVALASIMAYDRSMEQRLSDWLEELLQIRIEFRLVPGRRVAVRCFSSNARESDTLFANEGTGANQIPFILVPIGLTPPGESILLSEPEAHLHPKAQASLVSLILRIAEKERRQFFVETHSEHVLHSFLLAIAKGQLSRADLSIFYFENQNGTAKVRRLEVDERGRVDGGLPGFFEHSLAELSELLDSLK
jgi:predicted ATPase